MKQTTNVRTKTHVRKNYIRESESGTGSAVKNVFTFMELECTLSFS